MFSIVDWAKNRFPKEHQEMMRLWGESWKASRSLTTAAAIVISVPIAIAAFTVGKWSGTTNIYNNIPLPPPPSPDVPKSAATVTAGTITLPPKNDDTLTDQPDLLSMFVRDLQPPRGFLVYGCTEYDRPDGKQTTYYKIIGDVTDNAKFLSFFIPRSPTSIETTKSLASDHSQWIVGAENMIHFHNSVQGNSTPIHSQEMIFTNIVYVYHEDILDAVQIGNRSVCGPMFNVDPVTGTSSVLNSGGPIPNSGLNALTFDKAGNGYVSDSFNGVIWLIPATGGTPTVWSGSPLLGPGTGLTPPFGANGVEFNTERTILFVADTAFHQIIQIPVNPDGSAGTASIFITGINAPDGIMIDANDNIWICANQEDEIVVIDKTGKVIAKLGDFAGIAPKGIVRGLLFPASLAFSPDGQWLYVTTLFLPFAGAKPAIDSAWTLRVNGYTVSRLPAKIPPIAGD